MIDKYRLDDLRLESGEKGELARWVIQLQTDLDNERRKAGNSPMIPDGYALVPKEPTEAMLLLLGLTGSFTAMDAAYQKMLAASPLHSATSTDI